MHYLDLVRAVKVYTIFVQLTGCRRGHPASCFTIAKWIRLLIFGAYNLRNRVSISQICKSHGVGVIILYKCVLGTALAQFFASVPSPENSLHTTHGLWQQPFVLYSTQRWGIYRQIKIFFFGETAYVILVNELKCSNCHKRIANFLCDHKNLLMTHNNLHTAYIVLVTRSCWLSHLFCSHHLLHQQQRHLAH